jgi:hypothetical protein
MCDKKISEARKLATEFISAIGAMYMEEQCRGDRSPKHRGAVRRKSMDLTRILAEMRKP